MPHYEHPSTFPLNPDDDQPRTYPDVDADDSGEPADYP